LVNVAEHGVSSEREMSDAIARAVEFKIEAARFYSMTGAVRDEADADLVSACG
jgi:hypothetical protein